MYVYKTVIEIDQNKTSLVQFSNALASLQHCHSWVVAKPKDLKGYHIEVVEGESFAEFDEAGNLPPGPHGFCTGWVMRDAVEEIRKILIDTMAINKYDKVTFEIHEYDRVAQKLVDTEKVIQV